MKINNVSVSIITKNEEQNLKRLLPRLNDFDEVVIVDCGSIDQTRKVAESFDNVRFIHQDWLGYAKQKELAKNQCRNEWVLSLDADETFDDRVICDIETLVHSNKADGIIFLRPETLLGVHVPHRWTKCEKKLRFFRKDKTHFPVVDVHEVAVLDEGCQAIHSTGRIFNWGTEIDEILDKQNSYSSLAVKSRFETGKKPSFLKLLFRSPVAFLKYYIIKRHCLDGWAGFISAVNYAHYSFQKEAKLYCLWKIKDRESDV
jgi:glycosyltransferase involved in cell wall biosynthesis